MAAVSVASLQPADKEGWMTKQGGSIKTWKKRWFVLKGSQLFYFKSKKDTDMTGVIEITKESFIKPDQKSKKKNCFAVGTTKRVFFMFPDTQGEKESWMKILTGVIDRLKNPGGTAPITTIPSSNSTVSNGVAAVSAVPAPAGLTRIDVEERSEEETGFVGESKGGFVRQRLDGAKSTVGFLDSEDSKVLEFWQIWSESIPPQEDVVDGAIIFQVATAADMEKLTWRTSGPQNIFIQRMVDFFWNVGAPESEIDRLNDVGALINPIQIGSWIDMSGGMDGGWFFPVDVPIKFALEASDPGSAISSVAEWADSHGVTRCTAVGRDMGAAPPRQTEIRFFLSGDSFDEQLNDALSAFSTFGFPELPEDMISLIRQTPVSGLALSVITSSEGFVRIGLLTPNPSRSIVEQLVVVGGGSSEQILAFEQALGVSGPAFAEYQYLNKGFGYGVYKEGFDVVFHYDVGEEGPM